MKSNTMTRAIRKLLAFLPAAYGMALASAAPEAARTIEFTCAQFDALPYEQLFYRQGEKAAPLQLRATRRSLPHKLLACDSFEVMIPENKPDGSPGFKVIGATPLPAGAKRVMFLLLPKPDPQPGEHPLRIMALDDSTAHFPSGSFRFANATGIPLHIKFGSTGQNVAVGGILTLKPSSTTEGFLPVVIYEKSGKNLFQTRVFWEAAAREFVMITPPSAPGSPLNLQFISEVVPAPQAQASNFP